MILKISYEKAYIEIYRTEDKLPLYRGDLKYHDGRIHLTTSGPNLLATFELLTNEAKYLGYGEPSAMEIP